MLKRARPRLLLHTLSCFSVLILLLSACGAPTTSSQTGTSTPVKGGTWVDDLYEEPGSLIPNGSISGFSNTVDTAIWSPLFLGDANGAITPGLVTQIPTL